jgi:protease I
MIPGGFAPDYMRRSESILAFAKDFASLHRPVGAICHGAWLMASTFDLKGRNMTCFHSIKDDIIHAGANYLDQAVVVDKNYITSRTPLDLPQFMKAFIKALS